LDEFAATLMMVTNCQTTGCHIPENSNFQFIRSIGCFPKKQIKSDKIKHQQVISTLRVKHDTTQRQASSLEK
jgi:hypothetical protein